ncbi:putative plastid-lipid-associated protein 11 [Nymphaea thermarum]|nr:putative plastid-lipid-associated protein 11 [Nymphaea thermarum]
MEALFLHSSSPCPPSSPNFSSSRRTPPARNLDASRIVKGRRGRPNSTSNSIAASVRESSRLARDDLLGLIADQERGIRTIGDESKRAQIVRAIDALGDEGKDTVTTGPSLSGTWRMLWTTEKEQLFIIRNARLFGTLAGDVLQVIDVEGRSLNNVITFPPSGVFFVRSGIQIASPQRVNFRKSLFSFLNCLRDFSTDKGILQIHKCCFAGFRLGASFAPFWTRMANEPSYTPRFESIYLDDKIRVAKDIRGDYLVVDRAPYSWKE